MIHLLIRLGIKAKWLLMPAVDASAVPTALAIRRKIALGSVPPPFAAYLGGVQLRAERKRHFHNEPTTNPHQRAARGGHFKNRGCTLAERTCALILNYTRAPRSSFTDSRHSTVHHVECRNVEIVKMNIQHPENQILWTITLIFGLKIKFLYKNLNFI